MWESKLPVLTPTCDTWHAIANAACLSLLGSPLGGGAAECRGGVASLRLLDFETLLIDVETVAC